MKPKEVPEIFVDIHEDDSGLFDELKKCDIGEVIKKHMETGDVVIRYGGFDVGIEVKRLSDFTNSLYSGRLHNQLVRLTEEFSYPLLIIEGEGRGDYSQDRKAIRSLNRKICVYETEDMGDTISIIESIIKDIKLKKFQYLRRKIVIIDDCDPQLVFLSGLPNISLARAKELLDLFGTPENAFTHLDEWIEIDGISEGRLKIIKDIWSKGIE